MFTVTGIYHMLTKMYLPRLCNVRLVQVFVPKDDRNAVREALSEMEVEFVFTDANGRRDGSLAEIPVPSGAVDVVLDRLYDSGLDEDTYTVVTDVEVGVQPSSPRLVNCRELSVFEKRTKILLTRCVRCLSIRAETDSWTLS